jgi:high-affinity nickel permease
MTWKKADFKPLKKVSDPFWDYPAKRIYDNISLTFFTVVVISSVGNVQLVWIVEEKKFDIMETVLK